MHNKDNMKLKGHIRVYANGKLVDERDNLIVTAGKNLIIDQLSSSESAYLTHFGVGSSLVSTQSSDTELRSKSDITSDAAPQKAFTSIVDSGTKFTMQLDLNTAEPSDQPGQISEVGLFTAVSGGTMFSKVVHTPITKNNEVELKYLYDIEVL